MSKTKVIAFANNKGGSGKTTTCSNVACALQQMGKKVLMIDGDMQVNLTLSCSYILLYKSHVSSFSCLG